MKIKNIILGMVAVAVALSTTGCYEKFDTPEGTWPRYDDRHFTDQAYTLVSIKTVQTLFETSTALVNHLDGTTVAGGKPTSLTTYARYHAISDRYVIKGKVISNDAYGNFYRSLFILDETGGIEVKVGQNGMHTKYPVGQTVYVVCEGLVLGNYRGMLSLGLKPTKEDVSDSKEPYANKYMDIQSVVDKHVFRGPATTLEEGDIVEVAAGQSIDDAYFNDNLVGRLVRLKGLKSVWNSDYPSFLYKYTFNTYENFVFTDIMEIWKAYRDGGSVGEPPKSTRYPQYTMPEPSNNYLDDPTPTWGFQQYDDKSKSNFGSALFTKDGYSGANEILVRSSGYARFALEPITPDGEVVDVTGIVARYTDKQGRYPAYQISINNVTDVKK